TVMATFSIYNQSGKEVGSVEVDSSQLAPEPNKQLLHDVVVMYQSNMRLGTVGTKSRGMVAGSTKKMYRQKGTGNARAGSKRTNIRRGGGHAFAKTNVDYSYRLPRKAVRLACRMAIRSKFDDGQVTILDDLSFPEIGTKQVASMLNALGLGETSVLLVTPEYDLVAYKSSRNIPTVWVSPESELNAYNVLHQKQLVLTQSVLSALLEADQAVAAS
ncbi:MAG TPA: 50S ribosomal protein L4, partial [Planctomycetaceae bacterium]|nr:50S ribosomal protein L4 [Planctomycetaceae bacterium]